MADEKEFKCRECGRTFMATQADVDLACGHLCIAAENNLTQREAIERIQAGE